MAPVPQKLLQQLVRFVIEQYRDELLTSTRGTLGDIGPAMQGDREAVASDLLKVLYRYDTCRCDGHVSPSKQYSHPIDCNEWAVVGRVSA